MEVAKRAAMMAAAIRPNRIVFGYHVFDDQCSTCGSHVAKCEDDGLIRTYLLECECGIRTRIRKDDTRVLSILQARQGHHV